MLLPRKRRRQERSLSILPILAPSVKRNLFKKSVSKAPATGLYQAMATLSRLSTTFTNILDHLLWSPRPPLRSRCRAINSVIVHVDLTANYCSSLDSAASSSSGLGCAHKSVARSSARRVHCSSSNSGRFAEHGSGASPTSNVALLSREEALSESPLVHVSEGNFEPATPLCERPGTIVASLKEVFRWRHQAQELANRVGSEFLDADGGPEVSDLLRELEWLLDDAVAGCAAASKNLRAQSSAWKTCAWRDIKARQITEVESSSNSSFLVTSTGDTSAMYGAFGTLCRERHTDPVNEFAADCGCSCDGIRESLVEMALSDELGSESHGHSDGHSNSSMVGSKRGLRILLRMSLKELDMAWKERIQNRRPFQYVVAAAHWREYVLGVAEGVLIPRPETEHMVDLVESALSADRSLGQGIWADLGTGSGAIAIAVARLLGPSGSVMAVDASSAAVRVATRNIERYSLQNKVKVLQGFWFSPLQDKLGQLAGVISNPPYIPSDRLTGLQAEVGKHEPRIALDGGPDGMNDLREICRGSATALRQGGFLALETNGVEQAELVCDLLSNMRVLGSRGIPFCCFQDVKTVKDFAGITRFVTAVRC
ncbi:unnamed protein product [Calypogeia fissa]